MRSIMVAELSFKLYTTNMPAFKCLLDILSYRNKEAIINYSPLKFIKYAIIY